MPPKKTQAPKVVKGKAKAQEKEEKKVAKVTKLQAKGKLLASKLGGERLLHW